MDLIYFLDLFGTFVFAISGVLAAIKNKFDLIGATVIGSVTAIGGGSLRDVLLGETPVGWMKDTNYLIAILCALPICYFFKDFVLKLRRSMFLFDTIGISLFTILGIQKSLSAVESPVIAVLMGMMSAVFGGVIRDVLSNEVPLIFRKEIYATACMFGGIVYLLLDYFGAGYEWTLAISMLSVMVIRYYSVRKGWALTIKARGKD